MDKQYFFIEGDNRLYDDISFVIETLDHLLREYIESNPEEAEYQPPRIIVGQADVYRGEDGEYFGGFTALNGDKYIVNKSIVNAI